MSRPLPARLVLLAAAAALAAALVFALLVAEHRDGGGATGPSAVTELRVEGLGATPLAPASRRASR